MNEVKVVVTGQTMKEKGYIIPYDHRVTPHLQHYRRPNGTLFPNRWVTYEVPLYEVRIVGGGRHKAPPNADIGRRCRSSLFSASTGWRESGVHESASYFAAARDARPVCRGERGSKVTTLWPEATCILRKFSTMR
jgi:hypothetical protein